MIAVCMDYNSTQSIYCLPKSSSILSVASHPRAHAKTNPQNNNDKDGAGQLHDEKVATGFQKTDLREIWELCSTFREPEMHARGQSCIRAKGRTFV